MCLDFWQLIERLGHFSVDTPQLFMNLPTVSSRLTTTRHFSTFRVEVMINRIIILVLEQFPTSFCSRMESLNKLQKLQLSINQLGIVTSCRTLFYMIMILYKVFLNMLLKIFNKILYTIHVIAYVFFIM